MIDEIRQFLESSNYSAAIERIQGHGTPSEIAERYLSIVNDLYWKAKDLEGVVTLGQAGIQFCLTQFDEPSISSSNAEALRSSAKALAYNVASFTWPGWDERGIHPTPDQIATGLECANLNLCLANELSKPADKIAMAHWLVGAHELSVRDFDAATEQFEKAIELAESASDGFHELVLLNQGYLALAHILQGESEAEAQFDKVIQELTVLANQDSLGNVEQLNTARRVFNPANSPK